MQRETQDIEKLGLEISRPGDQWRCACCSEMQRPGTVMVGVPDGVHPHDPEWSVKGAAEATKYNGSFSGWCLHCCDWPL